MPCISNIPNFHDYVNENRHDITSHFFEREEISMKKLSKFKPCGDINATITGKLLYLILGEISNKNSEIIIPQRKLSDALHISKCTVSRNLRRLHEGGYIDIQAQYRSDDGGRSANKYIVK